MFSREPVLELSALNIEETAKTAICGVDRTCPTYTPQSEGCCPGIEETSGIFFRPHCFRTVKLQCSWVRTAVLAFEKRKLLVLVKKSDDDNVDDAVLCSTSNCAERYHGV